MKKLLSLILSLVMLLGVSTVTFAEGDTEVPTTHTDVTSVDLGKIYKLENPNTVNPEETFGFTISKESVSQSQYTLANMPMLSMSATEPVSADVNSIQCGIKFNNNEANVEGYTKTATIYLPTYTDVGVFTYKIVENPGSTLGVTYDSNPIYLRVTAFREDNVIKRAVTYFVKKQVNGEEVIEKLPNGNITNLYSATDLSITKTVTGNMGERDRYFTVKVTINAPTGTTAPASIQVSGGSHEDNPSTIAFGTETSFKLKHGETIKLLNVPYGVTYTVVEDDYTTEANGKYDAPSYNGTIDEENKGITDSIDTDSEAVNITNNKGRDVDTGIFVDNLPYIIILAGVAVGMGVFFMKKRTANNN